MPRVEDCEVGASMHYRSESGGEWHHVTVLRVNDDGTCDVLANGKEERVGAQLLLRKDGESVNGDDVDHKTRGELSVSESEGENEEDDGEVESDAATLIQRAHRAKLEARAKLAEAERQEKAAIEIQRIHRGRKTRSRSPTPSKQPQHQEEQDEVKEENEAKGTEDAPETKQAEIKTPVRTPRRDADPVSDIDEEEDTSPVDQLQPLAPSSADFTTLHDTLDHLTNRVNELTDLANKQAKDLRAKDRSIKKLSKKLRQYKADADDAIDDSYRHHTQVAERLQKQHDGLKEQTSKDITTNADAINQLEQARDEASDTRRDLAEKIAANYTRIQENWQTVKHYRDQLELKADKVDVSSKVEKADVLGLIEDRQKAWEEGHAGEVHDAVTSAVEETERKLQQLLEEQGGRLQEELQAAMNSSGDKITTLETGLEEVKTATDTLAVIGTELQGGHQQQDVQLARLKKKVDGVERRLFEANLGDVHDNLGRVKNLLTGDVEDSLASRLAGLESKRVQQEAELEALRSQLSTLHEHQAQQQLATKHLHEQQAEQQRALEAAKSQRPSSLSKTKKKSSKSRSRPSTADSSSRTSPTPTTRIPTGTGNHSNNSSSNNLSFDGVVGTKFAGMGNGSGNGNSSHNGPAVDDEPATDLERRMQETVRAMAAQMTRLQEEILNLSDADPLRRRGVDMQAAHDRRLDALMAAYKGSSHRAAMAKDGEDSLVVKIGDRRDALRFRKGASPGQSPSPNPHYKTRDGDQLVDIHNGRKPDGTWAYSPAQVSWRQKETRDLARKARAESPMMGQGHDGTFNNMPGDAPRSN